MTVHEKETKFKAYLRCKRTSNNCYSCEFLSQCQELNPQNKKLEQLLNYKKTHKLICPNCEGKTARQLMIENMAVIPMLVRTKCRKCGYDGMLIEVPK